MILNPEILLIGIGNSGRSDDGIGWAALDRIREQGFTGTCAYRYQLNIEDAELVSHYQKVLLIDACQHDLPAGFSIEQVLPDASFSYSTHQISPAAVAYLCSTLFDARPDIFLLQIPGYRWEIGEGLSGKAQENISRALMALGGQVLSP